MGTEDDEIKLHFLVSGSHDALPSSQLKLRSYLNIHSANIASVNGLKLPKCFTKKNLTCGQCFLPWDHDTCTIKIIPKKKQSKVLSKTKANSSKDQNLEVPKTHLVLKCNVCMNRSHFFLPKIKQKEEVPVKEEESKNEKKKKKKRKKDKTCGLRNTITKTSQKQATPKISTDQMKSCPLEGSKALIPAASLIISFKNCKKSDSEIKNVETATQPAPKKIPQPVKSKNLHQTKPHGAKLPKKCTKKKTQNLKKLKKLVREQKEPAKKTLKDFLTLIK